MQEKEIQNKKRDALTSALREEQEGGKEIFKTADLYRLGFTDRMINEFIKNSTLRRMKNGYYCLENVHIPAHKVVAELFPDGVLCMESALYVYNYIKMQPLEWNMAVDKDTSKSRFTLDYPIVRPYYTEKKVLEMGVTRTQIGECVFNIYDKERLICDIIKFENQLEHDVVKAALKGYIDEPEKNINGLLMYAEKRKVISKVRNMIGVWL